MLLEKKMFNMTLLTFCSLNPTLKYKKTLKNDYVHDGDKVPGGFLSVGLGM